MYTILINEDNTLTASVVERVMQQRKLDFRPLCSHVSLAPSHLRIYQR